MNKKDWKSRDLKLTKSCKSHLKKPNFNIDVITYKLDTPSKYLMYIMQAVCFLKPTKTGIKILVTEYNGYYS